MPSDADWIPNQKKYYIEITFICPLWLVFLKATMSSATQQTKEENGVFRIPIFAFQ